MLYTPDNKNLLLSKLLALIRPESMDIPSPYASLTFIPELEEYYASMAFKAECVLPQVLASAPRLF